MTLTFLTPGRRARRAPRRRPARGRAARLAPRGRDPQRPPPAVAAAAIPGRSVRRARHGRGARRGRGGPAGPRALDALPGSLGRGGLRRRRRLPLDARAAGPQLAGPDGARRLGCGRGARGALRRQGRDRLADRPGPAAPLPERERGRVPGDDRAVDRDRPPAARRAPVRQRDDPRGARRRRDPQVLLADRPEAPARRRHRRRDPSAERGRGRGEPRPAAGDPDRLRPRVGPERAGLSSRASPRPTTGRTRPRWTRSSGSPARQEATSTPRTRPARRHGRHGGSSGAAPRSSSATGASGSLSRPWPQRPHSCPWGCSWAVGAAELPPLTNCSARSHTHRPALTNGVEEALRICHVCGLELG